MQIRSVLAIAVAMAAAGCSPSAKVAEAPAAVELSVEADEEKLFVEVVPPEQGGLPHEFTGLLTSPETLIIYRDTAIKYGNGTLGTVHWRKIWKTPGATTTQIDVCWEEDDDGLKAQRELAQQAVADTWSYFGSVDFTGWAKCKAVEQGIRIKTTANSRAGVDRLGKDLKNVPNGLELNIGFDSWAGTGCEDDPNTCVKAIAIHELGHALGFAHEVWNARGGGAPEKCSRLDAGPAPNGFVTDYDADSIMNYCNPRWIEAKLSCLDIETVHKTYGKRRQLVRCGVDNIK